MNNFFLSLFGKYKKTKILVSLALLLVVASLALAICSNLLFSNRASHKVLPNIILISIDTLRPDRLSCYGGSRQTSPTIDRIARMGFRFTNAYTTSPWTLPAHASMLSGRYPTSLSNNPNSTGLYNAGPLIASILKKTGYKTGAVMGGAYVSKEYGASTGFDYVRESELAVWSTEMKNVEAETKLITGFVKAHSTRLSQPFFLFFHTYVSHIPYRDRRYAKGMDGGRIKNIYTSNKTLPLHMDIAIKATKLSHSEKEFLLALYDGCIARADEIIEKLISELEKLNIFDNTILIITSDHGEEFWEHTGRGAYHGHTLYNELMRIPLVWFDPKVKSPGKVISEPVSLIDIVPTILNRVGVEYNGPIDGIDIGPLMTNGAWSIKRSLFGEAVKNGPDRYSVRNKTAKLIITPEPMVQKGEAKIVPVPVLASRELYTASDLKEQVNKFDSEPLLAKELLPLLKNRLNNRSTKDRKEDVEIDPETLKKMMNLGYLH